MTERIAAAVLAAGESSRMEGEYKLLLPLNGVPIVRRIVERVRAVTPGQIIVVTGPHAERVHAVLAGIDCRFVFNERFAEGLASSFRAAIDSFDDAIEAALFALADQPFVTEAMFGNLLAAYRADRPDAVISRFGDVIAPPHLFARSLFSRVGIAEGGAKALVFDQAVRSIIVDHPAEGLYDVDDRADYDHAVARAAQERIP